MNNLIISSYWLWHIYGQKCYSIAVSRNKSIPSQRYIALIKPSALEAIIAVALFTILVAVANTTSLAQYYAPYANAASDIGLGLAPYYDNFVMMLSSSEVTGHILNALVWAGIGSLIYIIFVIIATMVSEISDAVSLSYHYVHPADFNPTRYWISVVLEKLFIAASIIVTILIGVLWANIIIPWAASSLVIVDGHDFDFGSAFIALIIFLLSFHVLYVSFRFVLLTQHFLEDD